MAIYFPGQINNVTDFGAFVDIGIGKAALLHVSALKGIPFNSLSVGTSILVKILDVNVAQQRVRLELVNLL